MAPSESVKCPYKFVPLSTVHRFACDKFPSLILLSLSFTVVFKSSPHSTHRSDNRLFSLAIAAVACYHRLLDHLPLFGLSKVYVGLSMTLDS